MPADPKSPAIPLAARGVSRRALVGMAGLALAVVLLVALSLRAPELPEYVPTPADAPALTGPGPHLLTIDASDPESWRYVSLSDGSVVDRPGASWDIAFRRFEVKVNGGPGFAGRAGALDLGGVPLDSLRTVPAEGYRGMDVAGRDTTHAMLESWYSYSYTTHVLRPKDRTYALRTAAGRPAALRFESYYCPGAQPGCVTIRYRFFDGGRPAG